MKKNLIFDIGANIGNLTHFFLEKSQKIVCFEANPGLVEILRNRFYGKNVVVDSRGLSDKIEIRDFFLSNAHTISTFATEWIENSRFTNEYSWDRSVKVLTTTLDSAIHEYGIPDFVKVDVEGYELTVFKGLKKLYENTTFGFEWAEEQYESVCRIIEMVTAIGYDLFAFTYEDKPTFGDELEWGKWESLSLHDDIDSNRKIKWGMIYFKKSKSPISTIILKPNRDNANFLNSEFESKTIFNSANAEEEKKYDLQDINYSNPPTSDLEEISNKNIWLSNTPLKLHLGCGEQYFTGYVNIDYPPSEHSVMDVKADYLADITKLDFPENSVDEIRLHHVFVHFNRVTALAMLIKWHQWLKVDGVLHIETPDVMGTAEILVSNAPWRIKTAAIRHLTGDQADKWAYHVDHWFGERFNHTLSKLGFHQIKIVNSRWPHPPHLCNVTVLAKKKFSVGNEELIAIADKLLLESIVSRAEKNTYKVWKAQLREVLQKISHGMGNIHTHAVPLI